MFDKHYLDEVVHQIRTYKSRRFGDSNSNKILKIGTKKSKSINNNNTDKVNNEESQNKKYIKHEEEEKSESESIIENISNEIIIHLIKIGSISLTDYQSLMMTNRRFCQLLNSPLAKKIIITECKNIFSLLNTPKDIIKYLDMTKVTKIDTPILFKASFLYFKKDNKFGIFLLHEYYSYNRDIKPVITIGFTNRFLVYVPNIIQRGLSINYSDGSFSGKTIEGDPTADYQKFFSLENKYNLLTGALTELIKGGYTFGNSLIQDIEVIGRIPNDELWKSMNLLSKYFTTKTRCYESVIPFNKLIASTTHDNMQVIVSEGTKLIDTTYELNPILKKYKSQTL